MGHNVASLHCEKWYSSVMMSDPSTSYGQDIQTFASNCFADLSTQLNCDPE